MSYDEFINYNYVIFSCNTSSNHVYTHYTQNKNYL